MVREWWPFLSRLCSSPEKNQLSSGGAVEFCRELSGGRTSKREYSEQMHPD